ncbi:MAG: DNA primase [Candidatus Babeliaceae bacterium]
MNIFTYIKTQIPILTVISEYTTLKRAGGYWKGHCPFHSEKTGSFTVSPHKEIYYCFGCHQGGDVIDFIAQSENCSQKEAAYYLIERYNLTVPSALLLEKLPEQAQNKKQYEKLCLLIARWCHEYLGRDKSGIAYLAARALNQLSIQNFMIGLFPNTAAALKNLLEYIKKEGFLKGDLINLHFLVEGKTLYSPFEERIILPIKDHLGNVCGFGGRIYHTQDMRPKYYNSHDHIFFNKGTLLFGLDKAKKEIQATNGVFLVEGYFDCIAMHQAGYKNTVATLGTACTIEHLRLLARYAQKLTVVYDGDDAGQKAILKLAQLCWQVDLDLFVIELPRNEDPASLLATSGTLEPSLTKNQDIFLFCLNRMSSDFQDKTLQARLQLIRHFLALIVPLKQPLKQDLLLQKAAEVFDIPFESLKNEFLLLTDHKTPGHKNRMAPPLPNQEMRQWEVPDFTKITILEKKIFYAILKNEKLPNSEDLEFLFYTLTQPLNNLIKKLVFFKQNNQKQIWIEFLDMLDDQEKKLASRLILESEDILVDSFDVIFVQFFKKQWKIAVNDVKLKLVQAQEAGSDITAIKNIVLDFQNLKQKLLRRGLI